MFWFFEFDRRLIDINFELFELFRSWIYFRGTKIQTVMSSFIKEKCLSLSVSVGTQESPAQDPIKGHKKELYGQKMNFSQTPKYETEERKILIKQVFSIPRLQPLWWFTDT